jgi:hypothetical protein
MIQESITEIPQRSACPGRVLIEGSARTVAVVVFALASILQPSFVHGGPPTPRDPLPATAGPIVRVSTERELQAAVRQLRSKMTIALAPGTYTLTSTLWIRGPLADVTIRGDSMNRDDVVLRGPGMTGPTDNVPFGIWTGGDVRGLMIANLTIRDVPSHPIILNPGAQNPHIYNVRLVDAGEQFIKANPTRGGGGVNNGVVEYSIMEYTRTAKSYYTNGVDVHAGANWIIRHNLFRNIVSADGRLAGPAILIWNRSSNTLAEGNTFLNCARGVAYGLEVKPGGDHSGGIIRNNFFYRSSSQRGDVGIIVSDSPGTQVLNNTVIVSGTYATPIEYRFETSTGILLANNLLDGPIGRRNGATGIERGNYTGATASMFVNAAAGDLHLVETAHAAIDRGVAVQNVSDDWDARPRPRGAGYDIGASEYAGDRR